MLLPSLIRTIPSSDTLEPEDLFSSSLGLIFTDDLQNLHGTDPESLLAYTSRKFRREFKFRLADPHDEEERRKFAHYLWNAGILMGELVSGRPDDEMLREWEDKLGRDVEVLEREGVDQEGRKRWWVDEEEQKLWHVEGETVLELGAGVGLAGITSAVAGAKEVVISDYPAPDILSTIKTNIKENIPRSTNVRVEGFQWGVFDAAFAMENKGHFSRILAADCLWMPHEHVNLAKSIVHFLKPSADSRAFVIAGFHTGRAKMALFFTETVEQEGLQIEEIFEMDAEGRRREWQSERDNGREHVGERKKWLVIATLRLR